MKLYLAWWTYSDPSESDQGLLGVFTDKELAIQACLAFVERVDVDQWEGAVLTELESDKKYDYISPYTQGALEFLPKFTDE